MATLISFSIISSKTAQSTVIKFTEFVEIRVPSSAQKKKKKRKVMNIG